MRRRERMNPDLLIEGWQARGLSEGHVVGTFPFPGDSANMQLARIVEVSDAILASCRWFGKVVARRWRRREDGDADKNR